MQNYFDQYYKAVSQPLPEMIDYFGKENDYFKNLVNTNSIVLDVGCGNGRTIKFLAPYVKKIIGIDYDPKMIALARENLAGLSNIELFEGDFFEAKFDQKFNLVLASYNLLGSSEISPNQRKSLLQKMVEHTKTDGHVVVSVWSDKGIDFANKYYPHIGIKVFEIKDNEVITDHGTFKRFTKTELEELSIGVGKIFTIIELTPFFYLVDFLV